MSLVNDDAAVLGQQEVVLQLPQQNAICHELQSSALADLAIISHLCQDKQTSECCDL